jgi:hypothetical protein
MRQQLPTACPVDPADAYGRLAALGPSRPGTRLLMIASVDGAASLQERPGALGGPAVAAQLAAAGLLDEVCLTVAPPSSLEPSHVLQADAYLFPRDRRR